MDLADGPPTVWPMPALPPTGTPAEAPTFIDNTTPLPMPAFVTKRLELPAVPGVPAARRTTDKS
jgi:hypothetical protein